MFSDIYLYFQGKVIEKVCISMHWLVLFDRILLTFSFPLLPLSLEKHLQKKTSKLFIFIKFSFFFCFLQYLMHTTQPSFSIFFSFPPYSLSLRSKSNLHKSHWDSMGGTLWTLLAGFSQDFEKPCELKLDDFEDLTMVAGLIWTGVLSGLIAI